MVEQTPPKSETPSDISRTDGKVFERVFADGMKLVEETAAFLDGPGRELASALPREASLTYAAWSMELTTLRHIQHSRRLPSNHTHVVRYASR